jgi:hypothetical protein
MSLSSRLEGLPRQFAILVTFVLALAAAQVQAQTSPAVDDAATTDPSREIAVAPSARDTEIADRLESILEASDWFSPLSVSVREGIVFLDGQTETDARAFNKKFRSPRIDCSPASGPGVSEGRYGGMTC